MRSGLQKEVLALYRRALRLVRTKPESSRPNWRLYWRYTFHTNSKVSVRNVSAIEHLIRKTTKQLEMHEDPGVKDCWVSKEMVEWLQARRLHAPSQSSA
ncbi:hypothetical protein BKA70DRAFT_1264691 [Coprinopsis sp. MPI-PUGE-AT-0042]|nr:hypothetical protein BKA70DRAFT_1264691 [Coprinopsis sp. MPI-PUGE-AT-0042]